MFGKLVTNLLKLIRPYLIFLFFKCAHCEIFQVKRLEKRRRALETGNDELHGWDAQYLATAKVGTILLLK